jgi:hypothetical protein
VSCERDLVLAETDDEGTSPSWRWKIPVDVRGVEIPELDEEQLPHSLRIVFEKGGAVCCFACQTSEDLVNLQRGIALLPPPGRVGVRRSRADWVVLGYCLNDEVVFSA